MEGRTGGRKDGQINGPEFNTSLAEVKISDKSNQQLTLTPLFLFIGQNIDSSIIFLALKQSAS